MGAREIAAYEYCESQQMQTGTLGKVGSSSPRGVAMSNARLVRIVRRAQRAPGLLASGHTSVKVGKERGEFSIREGVSSTGVPARIAACIIPRCDLYFSINCNFNAGNTDFTTQSNSELIYRAENARCKLLLAKKLGIYSIDKNNAVSASRCQRFFPKSLPIRQFVK
jgi:hypothetical protein